MSTRSRLAASQGFGVAVVAALAAAACTGPNPAFRGIKNTGAAGAAGASGLIRDAGFSGPSGGATGSATGSMTGDPSDGGAAALGGSAGSAGATGSAGGSAGSAGNAADALGSPPDASDNPAPAPLAGLAAYWRLDDGTGSTAADATGNGNDGVVTGGASFSGNKGPTQFVNRGSLLLDGATGLLEIHNGTLPRLEHDKSVSFWFQPGSGATTGRHNIVALTNPTAGVGVQLGLVEGFVTTWFWNGAGMQIVIAPTKPSSGWHHVAYTYAGSTHCLWLDGASQTCGDNPLGSAAVSVARLGAFDPVNGSDQMFPGAVDDVRVYDRVLTVAEVQGLAAGR